MMETFELGQPWIFLLIPLPLLVRFFLSRSSTQSDALQVPFFNELSTFSGDRRLSSSSIDWRWVLFYLVWLLWLLAAASPKWVGHTISMNREGRDIMMVVDISGSMAIEDMSLSGQMTDRLTVVKKVGGEFIEKRKNDRLGLVIFGTEAYLQTPLTFDKKTLRYMLEDATPGLAGETTAIGDALAISLKHLMNSPAKQKVIILLTDGVNNSGHVEPLKSAYHAKEQGIKVYTIGFGADKLVYRSLMGTHTTNPSRDLDTKTLEKIAHLTKGEYYRATNADSLVNIYGQIDKLEPSTLDIDEFRPQRSVGHIPMMAAIILMFVLVALRTISLDSLWARRRQQ